MALKAETKKKIASFLKIKEADFETALKDEKEVDLTLPEDLNVFTKEELEARDESQQKEGEKTGMEKGIKAVKKAAGLPDDAPSKDPVKVAQAIIDKTNTEAKVKPDEKVTQLTDQVKVLQEKLGEKDTEVANWKGKAEDASTNSEILAAFPKDRDSKLTDKQYLTLLKADYTFKTVDGKVQVIDADGKPLRDPKTTNPLNLSDGVNHIFTNNKWIGEDDGDGKTPEGRGGKDTKHTGKFTKFSELKKSFVDQGKSIQGEEFQEAIEKAVKDYPEFSMDK
jgi:hypothetical protein